jgi:hypothetical protein
MKNQQRYWIIVADDAMWTRLITHLGIPSNAGVSYYGQTDLQAHVTYIGGKTLLHPDSNDARPEHVIAHEMAHVFLNRRDEKLCRRHR